jgi:hypothetical protein
MTVPNFQSLQVNHGPDYSVEDLEELKKDVNDCVFFTSVKSKALVLKEDVFNLIDALLERSDNNDCTAPQSETAPPKSPDGDFVQS